MSVRKTIEQEGDNSQYPKCKQHIAMSYHSWLHDPAAADNKFRGKQVGRPMTGVFVQLGTGVLLPACESEILKMSVGERSSFTIPASLAYGKEGIPNLIPPNRDIVILIELLNNGDLAD